MRVEPIAFWLEQRGENTYMTEYDKVLKQAVEQFYLDTYSQKQECADRKHCVVMWWYQNKNRFDLYKNNYKIGDLINVSHSNISIYGSTRKKSTYFEQNTKDLTNFLTQQTKQLLNL